MKDKYKGVTRTCFKIQKPGRRGVICWNIVRKRKGRHVWDTGKPGRRGVNILNMVGEREGQMLGNRKDKVRNHKPDNLLRNCKLVKQHGQVRKKGRNIHENRKKGRNIHENKKRKKQF